MTKAQATAKQERETLAGLRVRFPEGYCFVTSVADVTGLMVRGGLTLQAPHDVATARLVAGTHRLSTPAEIEAWEKHQADEARAIRAAASTRGAVYVGKDGSYRVN